MAAKKGAVSKSAGLDELKADLKAETLKNAYIFYGEETYLRQSYLDQVREALVPAGSRSSTTTVSAARGFRCRRCRRPWRPCP